MNHSFVDINDINNEISSLIQSETKEGLSLINLNFDDKPYDIILALKAYVNDFLENNNTNIASDAIRDLAVRLGCVWGAIVCQVYKWKWQELRAENEEYGAFYIVSPTTKFCIPPFRFFFDILNAKNIGLDGNNDNTIALLFNMLENVEINQPAQHNYTILA